MFKKVLVAEDMDSINHAVGSVLQELQIERVEHAEYCDKAFLLAKKAIKDGEPFDLVVCDLSFRRDHVQARLGSGQELIAALKGLDPDLKVLVNSIEDHPQTVRPLWDSGHINALRVQRQEWHERIESRHSGIAGRQDVQFSPN